jgi:hypothetical protein
MGPRGGLGVSETPKPGQYVEVTLENSRIGSGRRRVLVLSVGHKWVDLFHCKSLCKLREELDAFRRGHPEAFRLEPGALASAIEDLRARFDRDRQPYTKSHVLEALAAIGAAPRDNAETVPVTFIAVMTSAAFAVGFNDARAKRPPREQFDDDRDANPGGGQWGYERGRQFARLFPGPLLAAGGTVNPAALNAYTAAHLTGDIL